MIVKPPMSYARGERWKRRPDAFAGESLATKRHKRHKKGKEREKGGENAFNYEWRE
jgi:hypothetical protein